MTQNAEFKKNVPLALEAIPLGRGASASEVGKLIAFLLSDDASYITGSIYQIDAGLVC
jgi:3-oxoacyl-[acyl-carrier protein] reductase